MDGPADSEPDRRGTRRGAGLGDAGRFQDDSRSRSWVGRRPALRGARGAAISAVPLYPRGSTSPLAGLLEGPGEIGGIWRTALPQRPDARIRAPLCDVQARRPAVSRSRTAAETA